MKITLKRLHARFFEFVLNAGLDCASLYTLIMGPLFSPVSSYTRQSQLQLETYVLAPSFGAKLTKSEGKGCRKHCWVCVETQ